MQNKTAGRIITFYSYKGGVGRTMALTNVGWVMASNGLRVLLVDWDLEAPGLNRYLRAFLPDPDLTSTSGLIEMLTDFTVEAMTPSEDTGPDWHVAYADVKKYATEIEWLFPSGGRLYLLPAGKQGPFYAQSVNSFNWAAFYDRFAGGAFLEAVKQTMRAEYDYVLIDSRTGITEISAICTVQMPDDLVVCLALNSRAIEGAEAVASSVARQKRESPSLLRIFPVPARVEQVELEYADRALESAKKLFSHLTPHIQDQSAYWSDVSVPYSSYFSFTEIPAAFAEGPASNELLEPAARLTSYLTDGKVRQHIPVLEDERTKVRERYENRSG